MPQIQRHSKYGPPPLSPAAREARAKQRSSFAAGAAAGAAAVALLALMALARSRANFNVVGDVDVADDFPASSSHSGTWRPRSAIQTEAVVEVTAAAVNALRESGELAAAKPLVASTSSSIGRQKKKKRNDKRPSSTSSSSFQQPLLPSSLNGLASLALDGDGGDIEEADPALFGSLPVPRATAVVPLLSEHDAAAAAATAASAAGAFASDEIEDGDDSTAPFLEVIVVAADAEVARALSGTSAETQEGLRLIVRDAAAGRRGGRDRLPRSDGDGDDDEGETRPLRRHSLPPLLPPRPAQLGGAGSGDSACRNAGARAARSEILVFLKPGVSLRRGYFSSLLSAARGDPEAQFFFTGKRASPALPRSQEADNEGGWDRRLPWHNPFAFNRAFAIRKSAWFAAGGFSPAAPPATDVELLLLTALDAPPRVEILDPEKPTELKKEENAGPSGKGTISPRNEPHSYLRAVQVSKKRLAGIDGERDEDFEDFGDDADDENDAKDASSPSPLLFATSLALITAHYPLPPQHLLRAHSFLEERILKDEEEMRSSSSSTTTTSLRKDVLRAASTVASEGCPLSAGADLLIGLVHSFSEQWNEAGRAFARARSCSSASVARVPALNWQASYFGDAVRRAVLEKCVKRSAAALEPGEPERPRREAAKADAAECVKLLVDVG